MSLAPKFIHLRVHTEYSMVDGIVRIKPLMKKVAQTMPAVALTDQSNLFGMVKFYREALNLGIKPLIGVDSWVQGEEGEVSPIVLLCLNDEGYQNLTRLVSRSYQAGQQAGRAIIQRSWLVGQTEGLIALSGGRLGDIGQALLRGDREKALQATADWMGLFPDCFYLELQRTGRDGEETYLQGALDIAEVMECPVVATNDVRFLEKEDFEAHEARVCINEGRVLDDPRREHRYSEEQYLRSADEMLELFEDLPEALENTVEIAKRCTLEVRLGETFLPNFPIPEGFTTEAYFTQQAKAGLEARLLELFDPSASNFPEVQKTYSERLQIELDVIITMGFPGYFLIVADFIEWARNNDVPVGPGRGSGAGSLVAYAMGITDLDPIEYDLLFERFLNPERVSLPDFDIDFCMLGRDRVIDYVSRQYGADKVSQIITYGTMAAKAVVRDVGRVMGHPYGFVDKIAKAIPFEIGMTLSKAMDESEDLAKLHDADEEVQEVIKLAKSLEGITRNAGKHAGGVVIAPSSLTDFTPLYCEEDGSGLVTQFDKDDVEAVGLVKFDFLGLRTLTIIDQAVKLINNTQSEALDLNNIPLDDPAAFRVLKNAETTAIFQLESRGMKELIKRLQPDCFEDIIALVALYRPGPLQSGMVDDFIARKHGHEPVVYPHADLEPVLKPTYGVILYQEQVMQIAQVLAGYTLGGADMLRRAMGKKKPEEMEKQRAIFTEGALTRGIDEETATYIFDLMEKFAGYGFNKSHSAAYALLSYHTAWLKAHFPAAFMSSVLSADMDHTEKVVTLIEECRNMSLEVLPPHVNHSAFRFTPVSDVQIRYGLGAIKGVGESALDLVLEEREKQGDFTSLDDLCQRTDSQKVNRRVLEALIRAGALDGLGLNRATMMHCLAQAIKTAEQQRRDHVSGQVDMFGMPLSSAAATETYAVNLQPEWQDDEKLRAEKETLGLYLSGHPISQHLPELSQYTDGRLADQMDRYQAQSANSGFGKGRKRGVSVTAAGLILAIRTRNTQRGGKMAFITLDDQAGRAEVTIGQELFAEQGELIRMDELLVVRGEWRYDDFNGGYQLRANALYSLEQARAHFSRFLEVNLLQQTAQNGFMDAFSQLIAEYREEKEEACQVRIKYHTPNASACLELGETWRVRPADNLLIQLKKLVGENQVALLTGR